MFETGGKKIIYTGKSRLQQRGEVPVKEIATTIDVETPESIENNLYKYRARDERYVLVPSERKYFDIDENETKELKEEMVISPETPITSAIQKVVHFPLPSSRFSYSYPVSSIR